MPRKRRGQSKAARSGRGERGSKKRRLEDDRRLFRECKEWLEANGGFLHPGLELGWGENGLRGVYTTQDLASAETILKVPERCFLVASGSPFFQAVTALSGSLRHSAADVALALRILDDRRHDQASGGAGDHHSFHSPYIRTLPGPQLPPCRAASAHPHSW